jgi:alkyldihydroxyacetonephosphate synthase
MPDDFTPDWTATPPAPGTYRAIAKMGRADQVVLPSARYFAQLRHELDLAPEFFETKRDGNLPVAEPPACPLDPAFLDSLREIVGAENVETDAYSRVKHSYGKLMEEVVGLKRGELHEVTCAAVHPRGKADVRRIVALCDEARVPLYVYGGGSSVNKSFLPEQPGVTLVMSTHMNRVLEVNELNHTCRVEAGCLGPALEDALNRAPELFGTRHRFTQGHFPQSFEISTVGGWFVTMGSGQASTYYGDAASLVLAVEMISPAGAPDGIINTSDYPATATGPRVLDMLKGSEGALGVITELTVKIFRYLPGNRRYFGYIFPDWTRAVDFAREVCQGQFGLPAVFRISDVIETEHGFQMYPQPPAVEWVLRKRGYLPGKRCICLGTVEGERDFTKLVRSKVGALARAAGGMTITGRQAKKWERDRYTSYLIAEAVTDYDIVMDTVETPVKWDNLHRIHDGVLAHASTVPGSFCMSHMSHFYPYGTNLYFIFAVKGQLEDYVAYRNGLIEAMVAAGGSPSHHHGVGRLMSPWMERFLGTEEMAALRALKRHFDPHGIMNPGAGVGGGHESGANTRVTRSDSS